MEQIFLISLLTTLLALPIRGQRSQDFLPQGGELLSLSAVQTIPGTPDQEGQAETEGQDLVVEPSTEVFQSRAPWYMEHSVVAHALGQVEGRTGTNSREAFLTSYAQGLRVFEADLQLTSDGVLVLRHDFDQSSYYYLEQLVEQQNTDMTYQRFTQEKINFKYSPLSAEDLLWLMVEYPDVTVITDSKDLEKEIIQAQFSQLVNLAEEMGHPELLDRLVVQIYHQDMLAYIQEIHPFSQWIFTLYQLEEVDYLELARFCFFQRIPVVTIESSLVVRDNVDLLRSHGVLVFAHTVNRLMDTKGLIDLGVVGVYSDMLSPSDLALLEG